MIETWLDSQDLMTGTDERHNSYIRALFEHPDLGVLLIDELGYVQRANDAFYAMLGQPNSLQGTLFQNLCYPCSATLGQAERKQQTFRAADGRPVSCLIFTAPLQDSNDQMMGHIVLSHLNQPIHCLHSQELELLLNSLPMPVLFKDPQLRYRYVNRAASQLLDLDAEQMIGHSDHELFNSERAQAIQALDYDALRQADGLITSDVAQADAQGNLHYFSTYKLPVMDIDGQLLGLLDVALDVTERKLAESERLTVLLRQRDALVQEVHHRIKNHLQGVVGLLQRSIANNPKLSLPLTGVLSQIESIAGIHGLQSHLGSQCLTFGQVASMIAELTPGSIQISGDGLDIELPQQEAVPLALTLNELVSNAFKHQQSSMHKPEVSIHIQQQGLSLLLQVRNAPATLPADFDFARSIGLGTGLRLLHALLPQEGAKLTYHQQHDAVIAELLLMPFLLKQP